MEREHSASALNNKDEKTYLEVEKRIEGSYHTFRCLFCVFSWYSGFISSQI